MSRAVTLGIYLQGEARGIQSARLAGGPRAAARVTRRRTRQIKLGTFVSHSAGVQFRRSQGTERQLFRPRTWAPTLHVIWGIKCQW